MNTKYYDMFNGRNKITALIILGFCLFHPMMAIGQNTDNESVDTTRCPVYDLKIVKAVDSAIAAPGSILTYTIRVKNDGEKDVENVLVKDGVPIYTTYVQGSATHNGVYSSTYNKIAWEIDLLGAGTTIEVSYKVQIDPGTPNLTLIRNTAKIALPEIIYSNLVITKVKIEAKPKLEIIKQVDKTTAFAADTLHYKLTVSNNGEAKAYGVEIIDYIPEFTSYLLGSMSGGTYDADFNRLRWYIQYLWPGESVDLSFSAVIDSDAPGHAQITNIGTIIQENGDISDTVKTTVLPSPAPKLSIIKEVDKSTAYAGDTLTYTLRADNTGDADDNSVSITDKIPQNSYYVDGSVTGGAVYNSQENQIEWSGAIPAMGSTDDITFKVYVDRTTPAQTVITNIASIILPDSLVSDTAKTTIVLSPEPRMYITKLVDKNSAYPGDTLEYTLIVRNYSGVIAENVSVIDNIPEYTAFVPGFGNAGNYDAGLDQVSWDIAEIYPGEEVHLYFKVVIDDRAPAPLTIVNTGEVTSPGIPDSDDAETEVSIYPGPKLYIDKSVSKTSAYPGDTLTYYLDISNYGDQAAEDVDVTDNIPEHTTYIPGSAVGGNYDAGLDQVSWDLAYVPQGYNVSMLQFKVAINEKAPAPLTITNVGTVRYSDQSDSDEARTDVSAYPEPRLFVEKQVSDDSAYPGDTLTYTLIVWNGSEVTAENINVIDNIPEHTTYVPGTAFGGSYDAGLNQLSWTIESLGSHQEYYLSFRAVIDAGTAAQTVIRNVGTVTAPGIPDSDEATTTVLAYPGPMLYIEKGVNKTVAYAGDTLTYELIISNISATPAEDVNIEDYIPEFTSYLPGTAFGGNYNATLELLTWTVDYIEAEYPAYLTFRAVIDRNAPDHTEIINTGSIVLPDKKISDDARTTVIPSPTSKLEIDKQVDKAAAYAGDTLQYTLTIRNIGEETARNIKIEDYIPDYTIYVPGSATGADYDADIGLLGWHIDYMEPGVTYDLTFRVSIDKSTPVQTVITNTGSIVLPEGNISDDVTTTVVPIPEPELNIEKSVDKDIAFAGDTLNYTLTIYNTGEAAARNVVVEDYIPEQTVYLSGSAIGGSYDPTADRLNWIIDIIDLQNPAVLDFKVLLNEDLLPKTEIKNIGSILFPDESKISDTVKTVIISDDGAGLRIAKQVDKFSAYPADTLSYTMTVSNTGERTARNVVVVDRLPEHTAFVSGSITGNGAYEAGSRQISWTIAGLPQGGTADIGFKAYILSGTPEQTEITNIGAIVSHGDPKSDTVKTYVKEKPAPQLEISKEVDLAEAYAGETLTYTIKIVNQGESDDETVHIFDNIPQDVTYVDGSVTGGGIYDAQSGIIDWNISVPAGGSSPDLTFKVRIDKGTPVQTVIRNIGSILYPDETMQSDTALTVVKAGPSPYLDIIKNVDKSSAYAGDTLTYTILVSNTGDVDDAVWVADPIPQNATYVDGSVTGGGIYDAQAGMIDWNISVPAGGSSPGLTFKVTVDETTPAQTEIENIGSILFPDDSKLSDTARTIILETTVPDIEIDKTVDSLIASPGSILTYSLEFINTGDRPITRITAWDKLPDFTTYINGSATAGGTYDETSNQVNWDWQVGSIAPGHSIDLSFKVQIDNDAEQGAQITNIGSAALPSEPFSSRKMSGTRFYPTLDTVHSNPVTTVVDIKTGEDDLIIFKEVSDSYTAPGNILTYNLTVTNTGTETMNNIVLADTIPAYTGYIPGSATGGAIYDGTVGSLTWSIGSLARNQSVEYQFRVRVDSDSPDETVISNQAFIIEPAIISGNIVTTVVLRKRISVNKSVDKDQVTTGDTLTYTITYTNNSLADVDNVIITDTLATGLNYIPGSATSGGLYNPINETLIWRIQTVPAGGSGSVSFSVEIDESVPNQGEIENFVIFSGDDIPIDTSNLVIVTITFPEMVMSKTVDQLIAIPGDTVTYSINAFNDGAGPLNDAVIVDSLPDSFEYIPGTATVNGTPVTVTGSDILSIPVGTMEAAESAEIIYDVVILSSADRAVAYVNSALLRGTSNTGRTLEFGPVQATISLQTPRLTITKTAEVTSAIAGSFVPFKVTVTNMANIAVADVHVIDSMSSGFFYVESSSIIGGAAVSDPTGTNPFDWTIGAIGPGQTVTLQYLAQLGTSVPSGPAENTAWARW